MLAGAFASACLMAATPQALPAQILKLPTETDPTFWFSPSAGWHQLQTVVDGRSGSTWDFHQAVQFRAAVERVITGQFSVGVTGSYAHMPLTYQGSCGICDAHAPVWGVAGVVHYGNGEGFHQLFDAALGATHYGPFHADADGAALPGKSTDFSFLIGYGFAYGFTRRSSVYLEQDYGDAFHSGAGAPSGTRTTIQQLTTRVGLRLGVGSHKPV